MEKTWTISGAFGEWKLTVALELDTDTDPEDEPVIDEDAARRALERFGSLDPHFCEVVNLTETLELARR